MIILTYAIIILEGIRRYNCITPLPMSTYIPTWIPPRNPQTLTTNEQLHTPFSTPKSYTLSFELHKLSPFLLSKPLLLCFSNLRVQPPMSDTKPHLRRLRDPHLCTLLFLQWMGNATMRTSFTTIITFLMLRLEFKLCAMLCKVFWRWTLDDVEGAY